MSEEITRAFVEQYAANFLILSQQKGSRFEAAVDVDSNIVGASKTVERIGAKTAQRIDTRHADTRYTDTPHTRRWLDLGDWADADLIDDLDKVRLLAEPTSEYVNAIVMSLKRAKDDVIIEALTGTARAASDSGGNIVLPAGQKIAASATGLTVDKLIAAKQILDENEVDEDEERFIATTSEQISNLLTDPEVTSSDYATVKALMEGKIDTYMGLKFIRSERLNKVSTSRFCPVWAKSGLRLGIGKDIITTIDRMPNKNNATQVFASMSLGAVRTEEARVVEIACVETA